MAADREWADAYLAQARVDFGAARLAGTQVPSAFAMLLQMTSRSSEAQPVDKRCMQDTAGYQQKCGVSSVQLVPAGGDVGGQSSRCE